MGRIEPLSRADAPPEMLAYYDRVFGADRDPVATPGTATGTPGDWWTIWAKAPDVLNFFHTYTYAQAPLDPALRGLVLARTGYVCESQFVFSQHSKAARGNGVPEEKIEAVPYWPVSDAFTPTERAALAYVDAIALQKGRVHDKIFAAVEQHLGVEGALVLTYFINLYVLHASTCRSLKMEYDNIPERIVEIPRPETPGAPAWQRMER